MTSRAALLSVALAVCACSTRNPEGARTGDVPPPPEPKQNSAPAPSDAQIRPAPFLRDATRVVVIQTEAGPRIAAAGQGFLRVTTVDGKVLGEAKGVGGAQVLEAIDVDGDGRAELIVGRGLSRDTRDAPASLTVVHPDRLDAPEPIELFSTTRAQIVGVTPASDKAGDLYVAAFESKYFARILHMRRQSDGRWEREDVSRVRVPGGIASLSDGRLAIARMYGDTETAPGDLFVGVGDAAVQVPTQNGVRAVIEHNGSLVFADGWHRDYGKKARALVSRAVESDGRWTTKVLAEVPGRWGYDRLRVGDTDGDGIFEVVAAGNGPAVVIPLGGPEMGHVTTLGDTGAFDVFVADLDGDRADEVIVLGESPSIWRHKSASAR